MSTSSVSSRGFCLVRHVRRNVQHLAWLDVHHFPFVFADPELQFTLQNVGDLFVMMGVLRHNAPFLQINVSEHQPLTGNQAPVEHGRNLLLRHLLPRVVRY